MASMSNLQKLILVSAAQNLHPRATTIQCHFENGHMKMIHELLKFIWSLKDQKKEFDIKINVH